MIKQSLFHQRVKICKSKNFLLIAAMFVYALIYNFDIKVRHFSKEKWKVDRAQRSHALCSRALVDDQNYRSGVRPLIRKEILLALEQRRQNMVRPWPQKYEQEFGSVLELHLIRGCFSIKTSQHLHLQV